ncbi:hypothetical protein V6B08_16420 [Ferrovibrio sp. MS7]|uniref:hypothetical protein n=1 Tax=Ferrovibrio plantarum TaxID=3119164 RepID=UPI003135CED4
MKGKVGVILLVAAVALSGVAWYVAQQREQATEANFASKPLLPDLAKRVNDVTALEVESLKGRFRIERAGEYWVMPTKDGYRVKGDILRKNILGIAELQTIEPRTDKPELYDRIQVSDPAAYKPADEAAKADPGPIKVKLLDAKNTPLAELIVGKVRTREIGPKPAELHVRLVSDTKSWLAKGRVDLPADPVAWLDKDMVRIERARVASTTIRHSDGEVLELVRTNGENGTAKDDFKPAQAIPAGKKLSSQYDTNSAPGALAFIAFDDVARAAAHDFSKANVTEIVTLDGVRATVRSLPAADKKAWVTIQLGYDPALVKEDKDNAALLKREDAQKQVDEANGRMNGWSYLVSEYAARDLLRRFSELLEDEKPKEEKKD